MAEVLKYPEATLIEWLSGILRCAKGQGLGFTEKSFLLTVHNSLPRGIAFRQLSFMLYVFFFHYGCGQQFHEYKNTLEKGLKFAGLR